jgi:hypothetical protein
MATTTSRLSFHQLPPDKIPSESEQCLDVFTRRPELVFSHRDIAIATGLGVNVAESRCTNLKKKHLIEYAGRYYDFGTKRDVQKFRLVKHKKKTTQTKTNETKQSEPR